MKTVRFIAYLFYRYYSTGASKQIPYFSTITALVALLLLHVLQILILLNGTGLIPTSSKNSRIENFFIIALCIMPFYFIMFLFIKKSELQNMHYDITRIRKGNKLLILYIIISILLIPILVFLKKGNLSAL